MKKQKKQMMILLIVLCLFVIGYLGARALANWADEKEAQKRAEENIRITFFESTNVTKVAHTYNGETYHFEKNEEDEWICTEDTSLDIREAALNTMVRKAVLLSAEDKIENVTDLSAFGLAEPKVTFTFYVGENEYTIHIGDFNTVIDLQYLCLDSDLTTVYTVDPNVFTIFQKTLTDLLETGE